MLCQSLLPPDLCCGHIVGSEWENHCYRLKTIAHSVIFIRSFIHSFIHSSYFYSASSSPLLLRGAPTTAQILCRSFTLKRHRQVRVKDLPKVLTWWQERDSNPRPFGRKAMNLPMSHHTPTFLSFPVLSHLSFDKFQYLLIVVCVFLLQSALFPFCLFKD